MRSIEWLSIWFELKLNLTIDAHADVFSFSGYNRKSNRTHNPLQTKTTNEPITSTENKQSKMYRPGSRVPCKNKKKTHLN